MRGAEWRKWFLMCDERIAFKSRAAFCYAFVRFEKFVFEKN